MKIREKGPVQEKKVLSVDDLAPKFKNRLAMLDTTGEEAQGGVKL